MLPVTVPESGSFGTRNSLASAASLASAGGCSVSRLEPPLRSVMVRVSVSGSPTATVVGFAATESA